MPVNASDLPDIATLLAAAVDGIGGAERPGQVKMAEAVGRAIDTGEHLAVQAGTGTGKSLAYLVPAARHAAAHGGAVVVSTATIALQSQLIDRDLPRLATALEPLLGRAPTFAILKGRRNYLCVNRLRNGAADDPQEELFDPRSVTEIGRQVQRLQEWAARTDSGDRDELVPGVDERAWRQVSVTARECIGAQRCPFAAQCFAELAREAAGQADIVVTNHALLAIDAMEDGNVLPEHDVVIVDEAHDLVDRVTSVATAELSAPAVQTAARRAGRQVTEDAAGRLKDAGLGLEQVLAETYGGRIDVLTEPLAGTLAAVRDTARSCAADIRTSARKAEDEPEQLTARRAALAALDEAGKAAERILAAFGPDVAVRPDVVWLDQPADRDSRRPPTLRVAPLEVGGLLAARLFGRRTVALTSATLSVGGSFGPLARQWGLPANAAPARRRLTRRPVTPLRVTQCRMTRCRATQCRLTRCRATQCRVTRRPAARRTARSHPRRRTGPGPSRIRWPGPGSTSARRSTIRAAGSCTWHGTCRRRAATGCRRPISTSSANSSPRPEAARSGCSPRCGPPGRRRPSCASGSATRCFARARTRPRS